MAVHADRTGRRDDRGKIVALIDLLVEHGEAIEYDLLVMGVDLADLGTARLTWRRAVNLVSRLGHDTQIALEMGAPVWSRTDQLLRLVLWTLHATNWDGKGKRPQPIPMPPNPYTDPVTPVVVTDKARDALARWKAGDISVRP